MHDSFLTSLLAELTKTLPSGKIFVTDDSLPGLHDVRDCVVQLVGQYSESLLWEAAMRSCIVPNCVNTSVSRGYFMLVQPTTYPATIHNRWLVPIDEAISSYLMMLARLIGQGLIEHQLRNCIGV